MKIIPGRDTDLLTPFPPKEYKRIFGWMHCYRTITETNGFPKTEDEFAKRLAELPRLQTFGVIDKNNLLNIRHEAPLIGFYTFDQETITNGNVHVASTRKAWGSRLIDQAGLLLAGFVFDTIPDLTRITITMLASNAPAKALAKRLGCTYEGCLRDAITVDGTPVNMSIFGLTRSDWDNGVKDMVIEPVVAREALA